MNNKYIASVTFSYTGTVEVIAENKVKAREFFENHFGAVGISIQSVLSDEEIPDWEFPVHPEKKINIIKRK